MKCKEHKVDGCRKARCRFEKHEPVRTNPQDLSVTSTDWLDIHTGSYVPVESFNEGVANYQGGDIMTDF